MTHDPIDILLGHNRWANAEVLRACQSLPSDDFHRVYPIGPGTLHDTMSHVVGAIFRWADRISGAELRPSIEGRKPGDAAPMTRRTPDELLDLNTNACDDFARAVALQRPKLAEVRDWTFAGKSYRFTVAASIIHVTNHGMHHRAQCLNIFRQLGKPLGRDLDELEWQVGGEPR